MNKTTISKTHRGKPARADEVWEKLGPLFNNRVEELAAFIVDWKEYFTVESVSELSVVRAFLFAFNLGYQAHESEDKKEVLNFKA